MGFLVKSLIILLVVAVAGGFVISQVPSLKQRAIDFFNPAATEGRLLGELKANLDDLNSTIVNANHTGGSGNKTQLQKSADLIAKSKSLLNDIANLNQNKSGILQQTVGSLINALTDKTPYPADHLPTSSASPTPVICPPQN